MSLLAVEDLSVFYGAIAALRGISLHVEQGEVVTLIGANGAGKSTTLRTISGLLQPKGGRIRFDGQSIERWPPHKIVSVGLVQVPEGRKIFANLTVDENLTAGRVSAEGQGRRCVPIESGRLSSFHAYGSDSRSRPARFPAVSSRCWRSRGRSSHGRSC